jgi:hypothetical protein
MSYSPIAIKRSNILGKIYTQCDAIESIPVYLNDETGELLGYADESMGRYADAFLFHLPETICKQLSMSHYDYAFGFEYSQQKEPTPSKMRIKLNHVVLVGKQVASTKKISAKKEILPES